MDFLVETTCLLFDVFDHQVLIFVQTGFDLRPFEQLAEVLEHCEHFFLVASLPEHVSNLENNFLFHCVDFVAVFLLGLFQHLDVVDFVDFCVEIAVETFLDELLVDELDLESLVDFLDGGLEFLVLLLDLEVVIDQVDEETV